MKKIYWKETYQLGYEDIDKQHNSFISNLINYLERYNSQKFDDIKNQIFDELRSHFRFEEELMKNSNYLGFYSHKMEHERFLNKFYLNFNKENYSTIEDVAKYFYSILHWFENHLEINDRKLVSHLTSIKESIKSNA